MSSGRGHGRCEDVYKARSAGRFGAGRGVLVEDGESTGHPQLSEYFTLPEMAPVQRESVEKLLMTAQCFDRTPEEGWHDSMASRQSSHGNLRIPAGIDDVWKLL